jgi:sporulation protein YlmC with PRC-barrel domain
MIGQDQIRRLIGGTAVDNDGQKIGKIGQVFLDDQTGEPEWATVNTGLLGTKESFVPISSATVEGDELRVPFGKDTVKAAPAVDARNGHLSPDEEVHLYQHYGMSYGDVSQDAGIETA